MSNLALRYSVNEEDAKENLNMAFLKVLMNLKSFNSEYSIATFIRTIFVRFLIDIYRKNNKLSQVKTMAITEDTPEPFVLNEAEWIGEEAYLDKALQILPLTTKTIFSMYAVEGFAYTEIADIMQCTETTCRWHVNAARKKLTAYLNEKKNKNLEGKINVSY